MHKSAFQFWNVCGTSLSIIKALFFNMFVLPILPWDTKVLWKWVWSTKLQIIKVYQASNPPPIATLGIWPKDFAEGHTVVCRWTQNSIQLSTFPDYYSNYTSSNPYVLSRLLRKCSYMSNTLIFLHVDTSCRFKTTHSSVAKIRGMRAVGFKLFQSALILHQSGLSHLQPHSGFIFR